MPLLLPLLAIASTPPTPRAPSPILGIASSIVTPLLKPIYRLQAPAQARLFGIFSGGFDGAEARERVQQEIKSAPVVVYSYPLSPFCVDAISVLRSAGVKESALKIIEPGAEWFLCGAEGSATRAALGEITGQTSMPHIFIGGESIGGLISGTPGLKALVSDETLGARLRKARAL